MCAFQLLARPAATLFGPFEAGVLARMGGSRFAPGPRRHLTSLGMQSGCWVPLIHGGEAIGTLAVASRHEAALNLRDVKVLTQVAYQVAIAVNNAVAFR